MLVADSTATYSAPRLAATPATSEGFISSCVRTPQRLVAFAASHEASLSASPPTGSTSARSAPRRCASLCKNEKNEDSEKTGSCHLPPGHFVPGPAVLRVPRDRRRAMLRRSVLAGALLGAVLAGESAPQHISISEAGWRRQLDRIHQTYSVKVVSFSLKTASRPRISEIFPDLPRVRV